MTGTRKCVSLCWILPLLFLPISVNSQTKNVFESTTTFRCKFTSGIASNWDSGKLSQDKDRMRSDIVISEINRKEKSAVIIGNVGKGTVSVIIGIGVVHFTEVTPTGNVTVLSVFDKELSQFHYPAVWSRHQALLLLPFVTQFFGECKSMD